MHPVPWVAVVDPGNMSPIFKGQCLPQGPPADFAIVAEIVEFGDGRPAGLPYQGERYSLPFSQFVEQHVHRLPNSIEPVVVEIDDGPVVVMIEQGKNALAIRATPFRSISTLVVPGDEEKRDPERVQEVGDEAELAIG